ncbi:iron ABC transporter substrate-binding protein [Devosia sp. 2618]|uniref:iron ABC transporter substrate-binding protein n=1 Tax=Devosia sp. 2618 TaxID=3156454 RepID=UPI003396BDD2
MSGRLIALAILAISSTAVDARDFTDAGGRVVDVPDVIAVALPAGPPAAVLLYTLAPDKLAGWVNEPSGAAAAFLTPQSVALPTYGRLTGSGGDANMEVVLQAKPDIIIDVGTVNPTYIDLANRVQEQTGIPYILIDGSFEKSGETYRLLGELLGEEARAEVLATYADDTLAQLATTLAAVPADQRPSIYYGRGDEGLETGLSGSINVEILEAAGATNVAAAAGKGGLTDVSLEQILAWNPDIIIAARGSFAEAAKTNPDWSSIAAVKSGAVYVAPSLPFGWIDSPPSANRLIGVRWLQELFYPDAVDIDLAADTKAFYSLFYDVDLTEAQVGKLVGGALPTAH